MFASRCGIPEPVGQKYDPYPQLQVLFINSKYLHLFEREADYYFCRVDDDDVDSTDNYVLTGLVALTVDKYRKFKHGIPT